MSKKREAIPNPEMLTWARRSSAMPLEIAADKLDIDPERLRAWEAGEEQLTISQLRKLGNLYKRPLAAFYYPKSPKLPPKLRDLRLLSAMEDELGWIDLTMEARTARERRLIVLEILEAQEISPVEFHYLAKLDQHPEEIGNSIRKILGVTLEKQAESVNQYEAYRFWHNRIEKKGILIFQTGSVSIKTARGFSIPEFPLPIIVVNRSDTPRGRIFTLIHEFVHIMLRIGGVCDLDYRDSRPPDEQKIEVICNHAAGAALVPLEALLSTPTVVEKENDGDWTDNDILLLSKFFGVSREVVLRRLLILGRVTPELYESKREEYLKEYAKIDEYREKKTGYLPPPNDVVSLAGRSYVTLILNAFYNDTITRSEVSDYLKVRLKHLPKIEELVGQR